MIGRRGLMVGLAACAAFPRSRPADAAPPKRLVAFDWGIAATIIELGGRLVGLPSIEYYNLSTVEPILPAEVVDVGLLFTPNFEILDELAPDMIIIPPALQYSAGLLERIATTVIADIGGVTDDVLGAARKGTAELAAAIGLPQNAKCLAGAFDDALELADARIAAWQGRPVVIASFADERHLTVYGEGSLFHQLLESLGLRNAFRQRIMFRGRLVVGMEELAAVPDAVILILSSGGNNTVPTNSATGIFWRSLPAVRQDRVFELPAVADDGGMPAALRFLRLVSDAFSARKPTDG